MPDGYWKDPSDDSWGTYKDKYSKRYLKLSFRDHAIPWLKNDILPEVRVKDVALRSGVEQYIDYLEGKFRLGKIDETMNEALEKKLNKAIGLTAVSLRNFTIWYGWKWSSFQTGYDDLSKLIMRTCESLNIDY